MSNQVLIIEDNATLAKNIATFLRQHGYEARTAGDAAQAFAHIATCPPGVVLVDYNLPGTDGLEILRRLRAEQPTVKTIMITGHGSVEIAVEAMKCGACDYLSKPIALADVKAVIEKVVGRAPAVIAAHDPTRLQPQPTFLDRLLGQSSGIQALKDAVRRLADAEHALKDRDRPAVLITGETGTGKELVARAIHDGGPRSEGPFIELNCAALPGNLIESELFGFERGAFTDAKERKPGLVELAHDGTLFMDEIGELELSVQSKLLRLIEEKAIRRLGALREQPAQVRIIAATNQQLERQIAEGSFRADLFFRLRIVHLHLPPLRQRGQDILLLARHFLASHSARYGKQGLAFSAAAERVLLEYAWPGNVRELRNRLEQVVLMAQQESIGTDELGLGLPGMQPAAVGEHPQVSQLPEQGVVLEQLEQSLVLQALQRTHWNVTRSAKLLGLSRDTLRYRMEKFALRPPA